MKLSQSTKLYFNYPLEEAIRRLARIGYSGVEIWGGRQHAYYRDVSRERAENIKALVKDSGMEISGFIPAQFGYPTSLCSPTEGIRADSVAYLKSSIDTAVNMDCYKVSICPGHTLFGQGYNEGMEQLSKSVSELLAYADQHEVVLLLEPAHRLESDLILTVEEGLRFIEGFDSDKLGIAMDTGHCHVNKESLSDNILMLYQADVPFHIHLDDNNGLSDQHKIPGEGSLNFIPFLRGLYENGYEGFLTVELGLDYIVEPDAAAHESKKYLSSLLEEVQKYIH